MPSWYNIDQFDNDYDGWNTDGSVDDLIIDTNRYWSGGASLLIRDTDGDVGRQILWKSWPFTQSQPDRVRFWYYESSDDKGGGISLIDDGTRFTSFGTSNPQPFFQTDSDGDGDLEYHGGTDGVLDYQYWTECEIRFDWANKTASCYWDQPNANNSHSVTGKSFVADGITEIWIGGDAAAGFNNLQSFHVDQVESYHTPVEPPSAPQNVSLAYNADDELTLSWDEVNDWGGDVGSYNIDMSRDGAGYVSPAGGPSSVSGGSASYGENYGPNSDTSYDSQVGIDSSFVFRARAENSAGDSSWVTTGTVYTTPIPPHDPSVTRADGTTASINWTTKSDIVSEVNGQYRVDTGSGYGAWTALPENPLTNGGSVSLSADARYQFRIRSESPDGKTSEWIITDYGNDGNVYFEDDFEDGDVAEWDYTEQDIVLETGSVGDAGVSGPDSGSYYVQLDASGRIEKNLGDLSGESDVIVKCAMAAGSMDTSGETADLEWYDGSSWNSLHQLGWEYNRQGWVEVTALVPSSWLSTDNRVAFDQKGGGGDYTLVDRVVVSDVLHEYSQPAAPSGLSADTSVEDEITFSWTNEATFADYQDMRKARTPNSTSYVTALSDTATSYTFTGLDDGERYVLGNETYVEQYRRGSKSQSLFAPEATVEATALLPAPTGLSASNVTVDSVDLSWTATHDYGDTLVQYKPTSSASWTPVATLSRTTETETVTGLRNGEEYDLRILADTEHTQTEDI